MEYNDNTFLLQASPSGMAAASQAVPGEFDSRRLLQNENAPNAVRFLFWKTPRMRRESRVELRARASILPVKEQNQVRRKAKQTIINRLAGRAAKGATLVACSIRKAKV